MFVRLRRVENPIDNETRFHAAMAASEEKAKAHLTGDGGATFRQLTLPATQRAGPLEPLCQHHP